MGLIKELANSLTCFRIGVWYAQPLTVVLIILLFIKSSRDERGRAIIGKASVVTMIVFVFLINILAAISYEINVSEFTIYNVIDYCSQTQAVYDHLWNCSYPINELLHSFLDLFTGVKKYVVYY